MRALVFLEYIGFLIIVVAMLFYVFKAVFGEWPWKYPAAGKSNNNQPSNDKDHAA